MTGGSGHLHGVVSGTSAICFRRDGFPDAYAGLKPPAGPPVAGAVFLRVDTRCDSIGKPRSAAAVPICDEEFMPGGGDSQIP